jgi:hypothetical protein
MKKPTQKRKSRENLASFRPSAAAEAILQKAREGLPARMVSTLINQALERHGLEIYERLRAAYSKES